MSQSPITVPAPFTPEEPPQVGDVVFIEVLDRPAAAVVLAVIDDEMLVEYELGNHSALRVVPLACPQSPTYRNVSYSSCPLKWLRAIVEAGAVWQGWPRGSLGRGPSPAEVLASRIPSNGEQEPEGLEAEPWQI